MIPLVPILLVAVLLVTIPYLRQKMVLVRSL